MSEIPAEAVQAAALALASVRLGYLPEVASEVDDAATRAALTAAYPFLAAQVRREERQHAMGVVLRVFSMPGAETHPDVARAIRQIGEGP